MGRTAMRPTTVVVMCKSGRLDAMAEALLNSASPIVLYILSEVNNPGLAGKAKQVIHPVKTDDPDLVAKIVREINPDFVLIGPEEPLGAGVVDELRKGVVGAEREALRVTFIHPDIEAVIVGVAHVGGDLAKSEEYFRKGLELSPRYTMLRVGLAKTLIKLGRADEGISMMRRHNH